MRYALRSLWKAKTFTLVAVATLAIGIGADTAVFSIVDAVLLKPLPFSDADRIVTLTASNPKRGMRDATISFASYTELASRDRKFARLSAYTFDSFNLTGDAQAEQLAGGRVTASFFDVLGIPMAVGPGFTPKNDEPGGPAVVVLGRRFWSRRFGLNPDAIGASLTLNAVPHTIVGALGIDLPPPFADLDVWTTRPELMNGFTRQQIAAGLGYLWGIGRLPPGERIESVQPEVDGILRAYARANRGNTDADPAASFHMTPIRRLSLADATPPLLVLSAAVGLVLLIACANVANLLLVRATARAHETAVRSALGATRTHLLKWIGAESLVIALAGGAAGTVLALWLVDLASAVLHGLPRGSDVRVNATVLGFSLAASVGSGLLFGLAPALRAVRLAPVDALRGSGRGVSAHRGRLGAGLVIAEVALSLMLLAGAGLLLRSFVRIVRAPVGFHPERVIAMRVSLSTSKYGDPALMRAFMTRVIPAIESVPGVASASASMALPPFVMVVAPYQTADGPQKPFAERPVAAWTGITPSYFTTMGIPLLAGRMLTEADDERAPLVAVISGDLARRAWPNESAIGKRVLVGRFPGFAEVVGVVGGIKNAGLGQPPDPQVYTPYPQRPWPSMAFVVRSRGGDPLAIASAVRAAVASIDRDQPVTQIETLDSALAGSVATVRFTATLLAAFAVVSLVMAAAGLYGVIAYTVERRTREVGIRMALGAAPRAVLALVAGDGVRLVGVGMAIGLVGALAGARVLRGVVSDVSTADPVTFAIVIAVFGLTAAAATVVPARRALRVDPLVALRAE